MHIEKRYKLLLMSNRQILNQVQKIVFESEGTIRLNDLLELVRVVSLNNAIGSVRLLIAISGVELMLMQLLNGTNDFRETTVRRSEKRCLRKTDGFFSVVQQRFSYSEHLIPLFDTIIDDNNILERWQSVLPIP